MAEDRLGFRSMSAAGSKNEMVLGRRGGGERLEVEEWDFLVVFSEEKDEAFGLESPKRPECKRGREQDQKVGNGAGTNKKGQRDDGLYSQ